MASQQHSGSDAGGGRTWIVVVAATGWVAVTTVAVLLASGVWSVDQVVGGEHSRPGEPSRVQNPGPDEEHATERTSTPTPSPVRPPSPRADHEGLVYAGSPLALVPRQATAHDR
jgi:hypothetical protein